LLAAVLALPALRVGWVGDDHLHRAVLVGSPLMRPFFPTAMSMFEFLDGDSRRTMQMIDLGMLPWWTVPEIKGSFWRPLTVATHWFDYRLWPLRPALMHAHSLLWFAATVFAAACFFRRIMNVAWVAGLAGLLFAIDNVHATPVAWLANRNIVIATFFGLCSLLAHDRWRRQGGALAGLAAPLLLTASLLATEAGLSTVAYLAAYAIFLDRGSRWQRLASLLPYAGVIIAWRIVWTLLGHGACHVGYYVDPLQEPIRFAFAVAQRAPILLLAQWAFLPADLSLFLGGWGLWAFWMIAAAVAVMVGLLLRPLLRQSRQARFWAAGMLLSLLPICTTFPSNRLLFFVGLGAMGLLAEFLANVFARKSDANDGSSVIPPAPRTVGGAAIFLVVVHLMIAPAVMPLYCRYPLGPPSLHPENMCRIAPDSFLENQDLYLVNEPLPLFAAYPLLISSLSGKPVPRSFRVLSPMSGRITVTRSDTHTLIVRATKGFTDRILGRLFRSESDPMTAGQRIVLSGQTIEVSEVSSEGMPAETVFRFAVPLEDTSLKWLHWSGGMLRPWTPPAVGQTIEIPAAFEPSLQRL
jgi:hypothetical protein